MPAARDLLEFRIEATRHGWSLLFTVLTVGLLTQWQLRPLPPPVKEDELPLQLLSDVQPPAPPTSPTPPSSVTPPEPRPAVQPPPTVRPLPNPEPARPAVRPATATPAPSSNERPTEPARAAASPAATAPTAAPSAAPSAAPAPAAPAAPTVPTAAADKPAAHKAGHEDSFIARLHATLESNKRYPTGREASLQRPTGIVRVWFVLARSGSLVDCGVAESSGSLLLDKAALSTIRRSTFPALPDDAWPGQEQHRFTAQLEFIPAG